jgi:ketosteroid isomerase-like protein
MDRGADRRSGVPARPSARLDAVERQGGSASLAEDVRLALEGRDPEAFGRLLADDARWGDDDNPRRCRSRTDVVATLARGLAGGGEADLLEVTPGRVGVLCGLRVRWPGQPTGRLLYHVYRVAGGEIVEIQPFDDRVAAAEAAGVDR